MIWQRNYNLKVGISTKEDNQTTIDTALSEFETKLKRLKVRTNSGAQIRIEDVSRQSTTAENQEQLRDLRERTKRLAGV